MDVRVGPWKKAEHQKNWCFWTVVLEKTLESPLNCKEVQPVHPKRDQSWVFIGRIDFEAETPILWPPHAKSWLIGKDSDAGRAWGQEEKGTTEDEMAGWHHWLNAHEFGWTPGVDDGQGGLVCCDSWCHKESNTTEQLNWTEWKTKTTAHLASRLDQGFFYFKVFARVWVLKLGKSVDTNITLKQLQTVSGYKYRIALEWLCVESDGTLVIRNVEPAGAERYRADWAEWERGWMLARPSSSPGCSNALN